MRLRLQSAPPPIPGVRPLPLVALLEKAIHLRFCSQAALGSQAEAGGAHGEADGLLQEAGPEKRRHFQRVYLDGSEQTCHRDVRGHSRVGRVCRD